MSVQRWSGKWMQPVFSPDEEGDFVLHRHHEQAVYEAHAQGYAQAVADVHTSLEELRSLTLALYGEVRRLSGHLGADDE